MAEGFGGRSGIRVDAGVAWTVSRRDRPRESTPGNVQGKRRVTIRDSADAAAHVLPQYTSVNRNCLRIWLDLVFPFLVGVQEGCLMSA